MPGQAQPGKQPTQLTQCRKVFMWVAPNCLTHQQPMECLLPPFSSGSQHSIGSSARPVCLVVLLSCYFGACIVLVLLSLLSISMAAFGVILGVGMMINECSWCCCVAVGVTHAGVMQQHQLLTYKFQLCWVMMPNCSSTFCQLDAPQKTDLHEN